MCRSMILKRVGAGRHGGKDGEGDMPIFMRLETSNMSLLGYIIRTLSLGLFLFLVFLCLENKVEK